MPRMRSHVNFIDVCRVCGETFPSLKNKHRLLTGQDSTVRHDFTCALEDITGRVTPGDGQPQAVCGGCRSLLRRYGRHKADMERISSFVREKSNTGTGRRTGLSEPTAPTQQVKHEPTTPGWEVICEPTTQEVKHEPTTPGWEVICEPTTQEVKHEPTTQEVKHEPTAPGWEVICEPTTQEVKHEPTTQEVKHEPTAPGREVICEPTTQEVKHEPTTPGWEVICEPTAQEIKHEPTTLHPEVKGEPGSPEQTCSSPASQSLVQSSEGNVGMNEEGSDSDSMSEAQHVKRITRVVVTTEKATHSRVLTGPLETIANCLQTNHPSRLPKLVMKVPGLDDVVVREVLKCVERECQTLTSRTTKSILSRTSPSDLKLFSWDKVLDEWKEKAPTFLKFLQCVSTVSTLAEKQGNKNHRAKTCTMAMAGAALFRARSKFMSAPMHRNAVDVRRGRARSRCYDRARSRCYDRARSRCCGRARSRCCGRARSRCYDRARSRCYDRARSRCCDRARSRCCDRARSRCCDRARSRCYDRVSRLGLCVTRKLETISGTRDEKHLKRRKRRSVPGRRCLMVTEPSPDHHTAPLLQCEDGAQQDQMAAGFPHFQTAENAAQSDDLRPETPSTHC